MGTRVKIAPAGDIETAVTLLRSGRQAEAEPLLVRALEAAPDNPDALHFLGMLRHLQGRRLEATELVRRAVEQAPDYVDARNNLGNLLRLAGQRDEAEREYGRVVEARPDHLDAWANLGSLKRLRGDVDGALECFERVLTLDPSNRRARLNKANALRRAGRFTDAEAVYRQLLERAPEFTDTYVDLGQLLYRLGRHAEAADVYRRWLERAPEHPIASHMLAACGGVATPARASDDYVREAFDAFAAEFDEALEALRYQAPRLVVDALAAAAPGGGLRVLDAGCGTGLCGPLLRPLASHVTGIDLSPKMVERARELRIEGDERPVYDELVVAELTTWLEGRAAAFDAIVAADVLVYFGPLDEVFRAAAAALPPGGIFVFTTERQEQDASGEGFRLHPHGRYSHADGYLRDALAKAGFAAESLNEVRLRMELGEPVAGTLTVARQR